MLLRYDPGDGKLIEKEVGPGESMHIPPGAPHQEITLGNEDLVIVEVSTPHFNDRVRDEPNYGMEVPEGGLPSTKIEEVEAR